LDPGQKDDRFVRNDEDKKRGLHFPLLDAFRCAFAGLFKTVARQRNIKIHLAVALLALVLGFVLRIPLSSWLAVIICIVVVFCVECLNTALETLVDLVSPGYHELAKVAKDCAAGAVLVSVIGSLVVAGLVFGAAVLQLIAALG